MWYQDINEIFRDENGELLAIIVRHLQPDFKVLNGSLCIGYDFRDPTGSSPKRSKDLFLLQRGRVVRIDDYEPLDRKVRIDNPQAALSYARLFSSPETFNVRRLDSERVILEVVRPDQLTLSMVFGDKEKAYSPAKFLGQPFGGVFPDATSYGFEGNPTVKPMPGGYEVKRNVFVLQDGKCYYGQSDEFVGTSGSYFRIGLAVKPVSNNDYVHHVFSRSGD